MIYFQTDAYPVKLDFNLIEDQQTNSYVKFGSVVPMVSEMIVYI